MAKLCVNEITKYSVHEGNGLEKFIVGRFVASSIVFTCCSIYHDWFSASFKKACIVA